MRRISMSIAVVLAVGCLILFNVAAIRSQHGIEVVPGDQSNPQLIKTLSLTNADIKSVLVYLSSYGGVNIVSSPAVTGTVTVRLSNVTWRDALDIILQTYGLVKIESGNYIRVLKAEDYYAENSALQKSLQDVENTKPLNTQIISVKYNVASQIKTAVKGLLSTRGNVDTDERTNSLIIRDLPENLVRVDDLIQVLDKETQQIKISAQLLEVESGFLRELGVDWRIVNQDFLPEVQAQPGATTPPSTLFPDNPPYQDFSRGEASQNGSKEFSGDKLGQFSISKLVTVDHGLLKGTYDIGSVLATVESSNKGKIIAHPEVTTLDNVEAYIQMGQKIPIKQFDPSGNTIITFYDVGTKLRVTPHVTSENRILLHLIPERSSYQFDPNGVVINTQNAETNVVVENGETAVIGGLTNQEINNQKVGLPLLKDIPIIGILFGYTKKQVTTSDLVIFVTPTIVDKPAQAFNTK
jgi:type IV pilus assembly protein PilQ